MSNINEQLQAYLALLKKWNKVFNLTAIESDEAMMDLHLQDSLNIQPFLQGDKILDVGSGAGLPGIPLAIACPEKQFYLLDTNGKRTRFLTQVKIELGLKNVHVIKSRVETYSPDSLFASITSRAFSSLKDFFDKTHPLLAEGGVLLAMKGQYPEEELKAIHTQYEVKTLPALKQHDARHLVIIQR